MNLIVLDLEMDQPSNNIIQVGWVVGNTNTGTIKTSGRYFIKGTVSSKITALTGITQQCLDNNSVTLSEAYIFLLEDKERFAASNFLVTWGQGDCETLRQQLNIPQEEFAFNKAIYNVKTLYQIYQTYTGGSRKGGLEKATQVLGLEFEGRPHDALCDAVNTFRVLHTIGCVFNANNKRTNGGRNG